MMRAGTTNAPNEIYKMLEFLMTVPGGAPVFATLSRQMSLSPDDPRFYWALGSIVRRIDKTIDLCFLQGQDAEVVNDLAAALKSVRRLFALDILRDGWDGIRNQSITPAAISQIKSARVWVNYSVPELNELDRKSLIEKLDDSLKEAGDISSLHGAVLIGALETLKLMLENYLFFGRDAVEEHLLGLVTAIRIEAENVKEQSADDDLNKSKGFKWIAGVSGIVISLASFLNCADVYTDKASKFLRQSEAVYKHVQEVAGVFQKWLAIAPPDKAHDSDDKNDD